MRPKILDYFQVKSFEVASSTIAEDDIRFSADYFLSSDNINPFLTIIATLLPHF